jgi:hypothetical protein
MDVDLAKLDDQIVRQQRRSGTFAGLQKEYLKRTGTTIHGTTRGYAYNFRGTGSPGGVNGTVYPGPVYGPMTYDAATYVDLDLKSIPVPYVLFDTQWRYWRSFGMYYADPLGDSTNLDLRWISLSYYNPVANLTAGDFFKSYTPLTLWNVEAPVYTFLEPTAVEVAPCQCVNRLQPSRHGGCAQNAFRHPARELLRGQPVLHGLLQRQVETRNPGTFALG